MSSSQENTDSSSLPPKKLVGDRYEILSEIGAGGLSTVYVAKDLVLKRSVAIKLLKPQTSPQYIIRLQREAKAICQLKHQNIIEVYDFFMAEGNVPVLSMELVRGVSLDEYLKRNGPLDLVTAYVVIEQICNAMAFAHSRDILHRDLKPGNVLLRESKTGDLEVKIIDFGIAKHLNSEEGALTGAGVVLGTPSYISPEQGQGKEVDHRSDIYSLGCLIYKCLTGYAPFRGTSAVDIVSAHINEKAPSLHEGNPNIEFPDELEDVVATALEKEPEKRFQTMDEFALSIKELMPENSVASAESDDTTRQRRVISWSLISALILLLLSVCSVVYFVFQYDNTIEVDKAKSDKQYDIRYSNKIKTRYVHEWKWDDIEGQVSNEQLSALSQLNVKRLDLSSSSITDQQLVYLVNLPISALDLRDTKISDQGIETILRMRGLQTLLLERCPRVTHKGYRMLEGLKSLKILSLRDSNVSDEDLQYISRLSGLILLYVSNSPNISDAAIEQILKLEKLTSVRIGSTAVTPQGIEKLAKHQKLVFIGLDDLRLSDDKMPKSFNPMITMLDLSRNPFTFKGLSSALALPDLWYLDLRKCPNITIPSQKILQERFRIEDSRILMTDGPAGGAFSDTQDEFYFAPEYYRMHAIRDQIPLRQKLIFHAIHGTVLDPESARTKRPEQDF